MAEGELAPFPAQAELLELLDVPVAIMFCMKDRDGRYVAVNAAFVRRSGRASKREVLGRRAADLFPAPLAERYEEQDAVVLGEGRALRDELELIRRPDGSFGWYLTTKLPVRGADGVVAGLVSMSRDLETAGGEEPAMASLSRVVELVHERMGESLRVADLAEAAGCSEARLERRMKRVLGLTANQYLLRVRVERAVDLLRAGDVGIAEVAATCGFYDQAAFTRAFARLVGETPAQFRARHRRPEAPRRA